MFYKNLLNFTRNCACWSANIRSPPLTTKFFKDFQKIYPALVDKTITQYKDLERTSVKDYSKRMFEYFVDCKLPIHGEFLVFAYELLEDPDKLTDEKIHQAYVLACAMEAIQCNWAMQDDIYDNGETRAGKLAWHRLPDTSKMFVNDSLMFRGLINEMLRQNIDKSVYPQITDLFNEMHFETEIGQYLDSMLASTRDFSKYTRENFDRITYFKGSCYGFIAPVNLALALCGKGTEENFQIVKHMCSDLGPFTQINNDYTEYLDCAGSTDYRYKSDFISGTCTWTAVKTLENGSEAQKKVFKECYGSSDPDKIRRVIEIYDAMNMEKLYKQEETALYDSYLEKLRKLPADSTPSPAVFKNILEFYQNYIANTTKFYYV
ncbi:uncharacterized protein [Battus philenor]|uniref:uncharacterized protein n=1 Tax=Battus philenor TaxID=42288 RepID=UPI0035CF16B5